MESLFEQQPIEMNSIITTLIGMGCTQNCTTLNFGKNHAQKDVALLTLSFGNTESMTIIFNMNSDIPALSALASALYQECGPYTKSTPSGLEPLVRDALNAKRFECSGQNHLNPEDPRETARRHEEHRQKQAIEQEKREKEVARQREKFLLNSEKRIGTPTTPTTVQLVPSSAIVRTEALISEPIVERSVQEDRMDIEVTTDKEPSSESRIVKPSEMNKKVNECPVDQSNVLDSEGERSMDNIETGGGTETETEGEDETEAGVIEKVVSGEGEESEAEGESIETDNVNQESQQKATIDVPFDEESDDNESTAHAVQSPVVQKTHVVQSPVVQQRMTPVVRSPIVQQRMTTVVEDLSDLMGNDDSEDEDILKEQQRKKTVVSKKHDDDVMDEVILDKAPRNELIERIEELKERMESLSTTKQDKVDELETLKDKVDQLQSELESDNSREMAELESDLKKLELSINTVQKKRSVESSEEETEVKSRKTKTPKKSSPSKKRVETVEEKIGEKTHYILVKHIIHCLEESRLSLTDLWQLIETNEDIWPYLDEAGMGLSDLESVLGHSMFEFGQGCTYGIKGHKYPEVVVQPIDKVKAKLEGLVNNKNIHWYAMNDVSKLNAIIEIFENTDNFDRYSEKDLMTNIQKLRTVVGNKLFKKFGKLAIFTERVWVAELFLKKHGDVVAEIKQWTEEERDIIRKDPRRSVKWTELMDKFEQIGPLVYSKEDLEKFDRRDGNGTGLDFRHCMVQFLILHTIDKKLNGKKPGHRMFITRLATHCVWPTSGSDCIKWLCDGELEKHLDTLKF